MLDLNNSGTHFVLVENMINAAKHLGSCSNEFTKANNGC
jgi:hypothetical protein